MTHTLDLNERRAAALDRATTTLRITATLIPELQSLSERLAHRAGSHCATGLPRLVRAARSPEKAIKKAFDTLTNNELDDLGLLNVEKRLQGSCPEVELVHQQWAVLKRCRKLVHLSRCFCALSDLEVREKAQDKNLKNTETAFLLDRNKGDRYRWIKAKNSVFVDIVDGGYEWVHIKPHTLKSMARMMAEAGWDWGEHKRGDVVDKEEWEDCALAKTVKMLCGAAKLNRHEYVLPRIRLVLPKLNREDDEEASVFIEQLERMDPDVQISIEDLSSEFLNADPPGTETAIANLSSEDDPADDLTPTLNLDTTVLIDLMSDITHSKITPQDWQADTTRAMILDENSTEGGLMAKKLYSVLPGRKLVCTEEVAQHIKKVLETVGTNTERERGHLLVPWTSEDLAITPEERRRRFCDLSIYPPPENLQIPITVVSTPWSKPGAVIDAISAGTLPPVADALADGYENRWLDRKLSVFMHGWSTGDVIVTSEKERPKVVRRIIEENRTHTDEKGPKVYELGMTRNLLSKNATPPADWESCRLPHTSS